MTKKISLLGVPMDLGQNRRGVDMGPSAIRYAGVKERIESLGICVEDLGDIEVPSINNATNQSKQRSEEHTSELQSRGHLVCRLLLEKKKKNINTYLL